MVDSETREDIRRMMEEDIGFGDVTSESLIEEGVKAKAEVIADQGGCVAGVPEVETVFDELGVEAEPLVSDGDKIDSGDVLFEVEGQARDILAAERVALNLLSRMSGIATATREMINKAKEVNSEVRIAATRKTVPLLRSFDKKAVEVAEGEPHRYHLGDFVLIKDNHLKFVDSVTEAVKRSKEAQLSEKIEIEVDTKEDAISAAEAGADIVMLDNFSPEETEESVKALEEAGFRDQIIIESSGGIDLTNVKEYASTGVDVISSSYMTMQAPALDVKLEVIGEV